MSDAQADQVELILPCRPEYVGVARLAVLGIASRMPFSYDEVEDVRLAVGEACTHAVERAGEAAATIHITSRISPNQLVIDVEDTVPEDNAGTTPTDAEDGPDVEGLGALLMEILVDEVQIVSAPSGTRVRLTKYAPE